MRLDTITPAKARSLLKANIHNRPISETRVDLYAKEMKLNRWVANGETIKISETGSLLDGQHRLLACIKANVDFKTYIIDNLPDSFFTTIDQGMGRTAGQIFHLAEIKSAIGISSAIARYLNLKRGITGKGGGSRISATELLAEYNKKPKHWDEIFHLASSIYTKTFQTITQSIVCAYYTWLSKYGDSHEFFSAIGSNDNEHPANMLIKVIQSSKFHNKKLTQLAVHVYIVKAFNAFNTGTKIKALRYDPNEQTPEPIQSRKTTQPA